MTLSRFKHALLGSVALIMMAGAAQAQVIIQPIFHDDTREVVQQRPIPANDRHRNYNWDYWRHHDDHRDDHRYHDDHDDHGRR